MRLSSLVAALIAGCLISALAIGYSAYASLSLGREFDRLALANLKASRLGLLTDEMVLKRKNFLPVYGSCELVYPQQNRIDHFFAAKPTGFRVAPNGERGIRSLTITERFAALGESLRGRQVVVILTPEWFLSSEVGADLYAGNFSVPQALAALSSDTLPADLKRRLALRMADFPDTLSRNQILRDLATSHASDQKAVQWTRPLVNQVAKGYLFGLKLIDPVETNWELHRKHASAPPPEKDHHDIDWDRHLAESVKEFKNLSGSNPYGFRNTLWTKFQKDPKTYLHKMSDEEFERILARTKEWEDFDLMLAILDHYGAKPLFISLPVNGTYLAQQGVSQRQWETYYTAINSMAAKYGFPVADFKAFEFDPQFFGYADPNPKGWIYINRVVDAFYHGQLGAVLTQL